jgi:YVTN family beta-propeller protein
MLRRLRIPLVVLIVGLLAASSPRFLTGARAASTPSIFLPFISAQAPFPSIQAVIPVGVSPVALALNPQTNRLYVANADSGSPSTVSVIDTSTNILVTNVGVGKEPQSIAVNPNTNLIYVANFSSNSISVIDGSTNSATTLGIGAGQLAINPSTNKIYFTNSSAGTLTVLDGATNATQTVLVGSNPNFLAVNPQTNQIVVANSSSGSASIVDGTTLAVTTVAVGSQPNEIAIDPGMHRAYVATGGGLVSVIDTVTDTVTPISVGGALYHAVADTVDRRVYFSDGSSRHFVALDENSLVATSFAVPGFVSGMTLNPATSKLYLTVVSPGNDVVVYDPATSALIDAPMNTSGELGALLYNQNARDLDVIAESLDSTTPSSLLVVGGL